MTELAFQSDRLDLEEWERAAARHDYRTVGPVPVTRLIEGLRKHGHKVAGYVEAALLLPLDQYERVLATYNSLPDPPRRHVRRTRKR